jgi:glycosyltransferase involved in cell wall biosynthesis
LKILVLSFYYSPDLGPGAFRASKLVNALADQLPEGSHIDVLTTYPNRYSSYHVNAPEIEELPSVTIRRIKVPIHQSGMLNQIWAFSNYAYQVLKLTRGKEYQLIFATSGRLMTATLGAYIARGKNALLYLDFRDLFVATINDFYRNYLGSLLKLVFSPIEKRTIKRAAKINLISRGFKAYIGSKFPDQNCSYFTNAISSEFIAIQGRHHEHPNQVSPKNPILTVLYAGNIGKGQGLDRIIPGLAKSLEGRIKFLVIGDGAHRLKLEHKLIEYGCNNVELRPPVARNQLMAEYARADILFVHLNAFKVLESVLPSKLFEYAASGKPIWAGVSGFAAEFINVKIENTAIFEPCYTEDAVKSLELLHLGTTKRESFIKEFSEEDIFQDMAGDILSIVKSE